MVFSPERVRLTTRGQCRFRRFRSGLWLISLRVSRIAVLSRGGGKTRLVEDLAADDPNAADKRHPVGVLSDVIRCLAHKISYRVVGQQQRPDFLPDKFRCSRAEEPVV